MMFSKFKKFLMFGVALTWAAPGAAWGPEGHRIIGVEAYRMLNPTARTRVTAILGSGSANTLDEACSWPDTVRKTREWAWSAPQHYINIPRSADRYERQRDCPDGLCVTEAILRYADELKRPDLDARQRWEAFSWLCHLVGDLHQPLHAGYRTDRGGNQVEIEFRGKSQNLHQFWDRGLIPDRLEDGDTWTKPYRETCEPQQLNSWNPVEVARWTEESHGLVALAAYPGHPEIEQEFADQCWLLTRQQWQKAASRLARILNSTLGEGEIMIGGQSAAGKPGSEVFCNPEADAGIPPVGLSGQAIR
jgi:hypothetical protein